MVKIPISNILVPEIGAYNKLSLETAYLAGLFDGEGCIVIMKYEPKPHRREVNPIFCLKVTV